MAIWKDQQPSPKPATPEPAPRPEVRPELSVSHEAPRRLELQVKESVIAADLAIEGKIEGAGHVRIAGRFKGDVHVQGNLTIEQGAKLVGSVRANTVTIAGGPGGN